MSPAAAKGQTGRQACGRNLQAGICRGDKGNVPKSNPIADINEASSSNAYTLLPVSGGHYFSVDRALSILPTTSDVLRQVAPPLVAPIKFEPETEEPWLNNRFSRAVKQTTLARGQPLSVRGKGTLALLITDKVSVVATRVARRLVGAPHQQVDLPVLLSISLRVRRKL